MEHELLGTFHSFFVDISIYTCSVKILIVCATKFLVADDLVVEHVSFFLRRLRLRSQRSSSVYRNLSRGFSG